ncbi:hypothetical protein FBY35_0471 [Streptomyces sp. SLBN-118]|nr:hypothetical protein FBY35_0471 [Streptomyces sp. SLBN-118]
MKTNSAARRPAEKLVRGLLLVSAGILTAVTGVVIWAVSTLGGGPPLVAAIVVIAAPWAIIHWLTTRPRSRRPKDEMVQSSASASP